MCIMTLYDCMCIHKVVYSIFSGGRAWMIHFVCVCVCAAAMHILAIVPYHCERGPTTEYWPTPHFGLNFLLRSNVYSNTMHPCVAALEKHSSNRD